MRIKLIPVLLLFAFFLSVTKAQDLNNEHPNESTEIAPIRNPNPGNPEVASDTYWELLWAAPVGVGGGEAGIESDGNFIYTTKWNGDEFYRYNMDGVYIETFTCGEASQIRDLAYDGTYFYGGAAGTTVYEMDFDNQVVVSTITAPVAVRAIAYDNYYDGFYANNWSTEITLFNRSGVVLNSFSPWYYENYYGFAYDNVDGSGPFLWGFSQDGSGGVAVQMELPSGYETGFTYDIVAELGGPDDLAGGCALVDLGYHYVFLGMVQNLVICAYSLYYILPSHDVGIQEIVEPSSGQNLGNNEPVTIVIKNYGMMSQSYIPYEVTWNGNSYSGIYTGTIPYDVSVEITLPVTADLSAPGEYIFEACTNLEDDQDPFNDCKTRVVISESLPPPQNLQVSVTGNDVSMQWDEPEPTTSNLLGYQVYLDGEIITDTLTETSWNIAGCPDGSHWVSVSAVYDDGESEMAEPVHVEIGALAGKLQGFIRDAVTKLNVPSAWISANDVEFGAVSYATPFGSHYSLHLPGGTYAVTCNADGYDPVTYNNVAIPNGATRALSFYLNPEGSDKEISAAGFKNGNAERHSGKSIIIHPNPAKEMVTVSSNCHILSLRLLDLNGQLLHHTTASGNEIHLNTSTFEPGIYVLEIETENGINMQKLVIQ
ncbi:MAG: T9SS type A sorting domain-containing protein [Bacteroidales bacterium]